MLNPVGKTKRPDWANPYEPTWTGGQWVVVFPDEYSAKRGLLIMQPDAPRLSAAPYPDGGNAWYVGVAD